MGRPDPVMQMFKKENFLPLLVPRQDILPLQLVGMSGKDLSPLGEVSTALVAPAGVSLPPIVSDIATAASMEGKASSQVKLSVGLEILGNILNALAGSKMDVSAAYEKATSVTFKFSDVSADKVEITKLDQFLGKANIHPDSKHIERMMIADKVGILTMTLKSKKFTVSAQGESGLNVGVDVPVIQGIASGKLKVESKKADNSEIAFEGATPITFAAQGVRLFFDDRGHYTAFDPFKAGQGAIRGEGDSGRDTSGFEPEMLAIEGGFVRFGDDAKAAGAK
jgi:hypothetical protein